MARKNEVTSYLYQYTDSFAGALSQLNWANNAMSRPYNFVDTGTLSGVGYVAIDILGTAKVWSPAGNSPDSNWTTGLNWGGTAPVGGDQLVFDGSDRLVNSNNNADNTPFAGIRFLSSSGAFVLNESSQGNNTVRLIGNIVNESPYQQTINVGLQLFGTSPIVNAQAGDIKITSNIEQAGPTSGGLIKTGTHLLWNTGSNSYSGATEIQQGVLRAQDGTGLPSGSNLKFNGGILESYGTFARNMGTASGQVQWITSGGFSARDGTLTVNIGGVAGAVTWGSGNFVADGSALKFSAASATDTVYFKNPIDFGTQVREINVANGGAAIDAVLDGALTGGTGSGLNKTGVGTLLLGNNSTLGTATVAGGALLINSGKMLSASGAVTVNSGATIGGRGTISGAVTLNGGAHLAPGVGSGNIGTLAVDNLSLGNQFVYNWELGDDGSNGIGTGDLVDVNTLGFAGDQWTLSLGIEAGLKDSRPDLFGPQLVGNEYKLFGFADTPGNWQSAYGLRDAATITFLGNGYWNTDGATVTVHDNAVWLSGVWLIPEPNVLVLWLSGLATVYFARRRRLKKPARSMLK